MPLPLLLLAQPPTPLLLPLLLPVGGVAIAIAVGSTTRPFVSSAVLCFAWRQA